MFLNGHELDRIVTARRDAWQHVLGKLAIAMHPRLLARHAHMRFVDQRSGDRSGIKRMLPLKRHLRAPNLPRVVMAVRILHRPPNERGHPVAPRAIGPDHMKFHQLPVRKLICLHLNLPDPVADHHHRPAFPVPIVEVPDQRHRFGGRCPLPDCPASRGSVIVDAHNLVAIGIGCQ